MAEHPIGQLIAAGAFVTNTDDPHMFNTNLTDEYIVLANTFDLDRSSLSRMISNAARASFLPTTRKEQILGDIELAPSLADGAAG